jgi:hypothetical protein
MFVFGARHCRSLRHLCCEPITNVPANFGRTVGFVFALEQFISTRIARISDFHPGRIAVLDKTKALHYESFMIVLPALVWFSLWLGIQPKPSQSQLPKGFWLSDGYGLLVQFDGSELRTFEITTISCVTSRRAQLLPIAQPGFIGTIYSSGHEMIRISPTKNPDVLRMHTDGTASDIVLHRTPKLPNICQTSPPNTPQRNYAIFWQTFAEQYPFFVLHGVNWHAVDKKFRPQITSRTKPTELFEIFRQMIEPLQDAHTGIEAEEIKAAFDGWRKDPNHLEESDWKKAESVIGQKYVHRGLRHYCKDHVQFGTVRTGIGYLRVTAFYGYVDDGGYRSELKCLQKSVNTIFSDSAKWSGLVIDVRLNHGGDDPLGIEIASRLTKTRYLAYFKAARNSIDLDAPLHFTARQSSWVLPSARPGFYGRVALLVGPDTVSAGETFAMALLDRKPRVTLIGGKTQGVFSDVLSRHLPNGWRFRLPNEVYLTSHGQSFDRTGVPPNVRIAFFSKADLQNGRDYAVEEAVKRLETRPRRAAP